MVEMKRQEMWGRGYMYIQWGEKSVGTPKYVK
jgi:hypothetical protein